MSRFDWVERHRSHVQIMGIINRTPDSFSDGGRFLDDEAALARVDEMMAAGAAIIDVGAESTRPGAAQVPAAQQIERLGAIIPQLVARGVRVSVDTTSPRVAEHALGQGACMVNSVALEPAAALARVACEHDADLVLMHCRGSMQEMAGFSHYRDDAYADVVVEVAEEWTRAAGQALACGLAKERLWFDPGLGFAKNAAQSLTLCSRLAELKQRVGGYRMLVGASRKSFLAAAVARAEEGREGVRPPVDRRLGASVAAALDAAAQGAEIVRVHDVEETAQALRYQAVLKQRRQQRGAHV